MLKLIGFLDRQSRIYLLTLGIVGTILVSLADYITGSEFLFSLFYFIPIALLAWFVGRRAGVIVSFLSALLALTADLLGGATYSVAAVPYWNAGIRLGMFLVVTYALSALHEAQVRQQELQQFIVHDLRSPLANIMTALETLQDFDGETLNATQQQLLEMSMISGSRMLTLINSLLDLAYLESGQMPLQCELIAASEIIDQSLLQVSVWARRNHVNLTSQVAAGIDTVYSDRTLLVRVLVNLLSNAIKFSPPDSTVTISIAPAEVGRAAFHVTDQGRGIPKEWADKVFDKFVQVEAHRAGNPVGSGLGLTFCREAVEAQGGRIWIEEHSDPGTTVVFTVPTEPSGVKR
jgi:signal transduction histidine kinase